MDVYMFICMFKHNSGTPEAISIKLDTNLTYNLKKKWDLRHLYTHRLSCIRNISQTCIFQGSIHLFLKNFKGVSINNQTKFKI